MEKLIVKNFGPIKEAEIDLTKYVVFIGDTSTGKSVLAKLISIFRDFSNVVGNKYDDLDYEKELDLTNQLKNYNIDFDFEDSYFEFSNSDLLITIEKKKISNIRDGSEKIKLSNLEALGDFHNLEMKKTLLSLLNNTRKSIYFPPERILTSLIGSSISGLWANNVALPVCFKNFAANYEVARKEKQNVSFEDFGFSYAFVNNEELIYNPSGEFQLNKASSGIQSLLPLLLVLNHELRSEVLKPELNFLVEEPELNLFPIKQKKLIDYLIQNISKTNHKLIITTHSPYILSALDTLILAKNTFDEHTSLKDVISKIVFEQRWIDYNEISVYEVRNDGIVYSIKNEEFRSIDTNAIDKVSDIISEEFDKLTELRYAQ
ncbi:AAA family ATPase [Flavobacterium sp. KACC 22763]|uniref:AAA family ATPase n=1 Tax=Flavobacterium sp. KACC 22763 TaxID=3025668 RepID=UPI0023661C71|nr:AAA family ATPase [Flavobacterium sp. KACC 22763]WDF65118.1 AAA family ATPase [Flavobacterium sp. KACC 22763]